MRNLRARDSGLTDDRLKLVGDLVGGARTIKCYGWEEKYVDKIKVIRDKQTCNLMKFNMLAHLGSAIYQNMGLICILLIFLHKWFSGEALDISNAFSLLALVFFTFVAVGNF
jgi:hypothetical protein